MPKFIQDEARQQYSKQLRHFMQQLNPKMSKSEIERIKLKKIEMRGKSEADKNPDK